MSLVFLCVFFFAVQTVVARSPVRSALFDDNGVMFLALPDVLTFLFSIHGLGLSLHFFWTPLTYIFLHGSAAHLIINMFGLLTFGSALEREFGKRTMLVVFFVSGIVGGLGWVALKGLESSQPCVGASAAALGVIGAFAALRPKAEFDLLIPFFSPWVRAWELAVFLIAVNTLELFFGRGHIAYSAHLFGIVTGVLCGLAARLIAERKRKINLPKENEKERKKS